MLLPPLRVRRCCPDHIADLRDVCEQEVLTAPPTRRIYYAALRDTPDAIGPLTADSALSAEAARANGIKSDVAGRPDVLIAPTMESASMVVRTLTGLTGGLAAGVVLGATLPILIPSRTDSMEVRMASCVLAALIQMARYEGTVKGSTTAAVPGRVEAVGVPA